MSNDLKCNSFINSVNFLKILDRTLCHFMFFKTGELQFAFVLMTEKHAISSLSTKSFLCYVLKCFNFYNCKSSQQRRSK
jgi:hypothetical protein